MYHGILFIYADMSVIWFACAVPVSPSQVIDMEPRVEGQVTFDVVHEVLKSLRVLTVLSKIQKIQLSCSGW